MFRHLAWAPIVFVAGVAQAAPDDYRWQALDPFPKREVGVVLEVQIVDTSGRPQAGATILDARFDKSPDGQPNAYAPVTYVGPRGYGVYAFKTDINTDGRYALSIVAQMPFETTPSSGSVTFTVPRPAAPAQQP